MSRLNRLFTYPATPLVSPMENFATQALAIAIDQDSRPVLRALAGLESTPRQAALLERVKARVVDGVKVHTQTQRHLPPDGELGKGFLDLVLTLDPGDLETVVWFENKIDGGAPGTGQVKGYLAYAASLEAPPLVVTLTSTGAPLDEDAPALSWNQLMAHVDGESGTWWHELREFLEEKGVVYPPPPEDGHPLGYFTAVVTANETIAHLWPSELLHWSQPKKMRAFAENRYASRKDLAISGGPLLYGMMNDGLGTWEWRVMVGDGSNAYDKVEASPGAVLRAAEQGNLPDWWERDGTSPNAVLLKRTPWSKDQQIPEIAAWLVQAFHDLAAAGVLTPYLTALHAKWDRKKLVSRAEEESKQMPAHA